MHKLLSSKKNHLVLQDDHKLLSHTKKTLVQYVDKMMMMFTMHQTNALSLIFIDKLVLAH